MCNKSILTIATGKQVYIDMVIALARSFILWNKPTDIAFYIATDQKQVLAKDVLKWAKIIELRPGELGEGFSPKLYLDKLAPTTKTLFIDSDCLITGNLDFIFEKFEGNSVSVIGSQISKGEWFGDIASVCKKFNVESMPKFNGGIYYLEKGDVSNKVYAKARELELQYDEIGFVRLRNRPNDEVLMSLAMAIYNQKPIEDNGTIMSDPQSCSGGTYIDVFKGKSLLINPSLPDERHKSWYPFEKVSPVIVHFLGYYTSHYTYIREEKKLQFVFKNKIPLNLANFVALFTITIPYKINEGLKNLFRPLFRLIFGYRKLKKSNRI